MTLVKMSPSSWLYYAEEIADGREDYWAEEKMPAAWVGRGALALGLGDESPSAETLERLFAHGTDPGNGAPLGRAIAPRDSRAVAGFAMTFAPPKSVSVLWALADEDSAREVMRSHAIAAGSALSFLEEHAAFTRRGRGGVYQVDTKGLVAAAFTHRTSRAADPQVHTHLLVANKVQAEDGAWLSLDARELYTHQSAAGMLYKAALRAELTTRLGVAWTAIEDNGAAEIVGVPSELIAKWSTRREQVTRAGEQLIARRSAELGRSLSANERAEALQLAAYRTRAPKVTGAESTADLCARWEEEAAAWGLPASDWLSGVLRRDNGRVAPWNAEAITTVIEDALARLEDEYATWGRAEAVEVLSTLAPGQSAEEIRARVEEAADQLLAHDEVRCLASPLPAEPPETLRRRDGMAVIERHGAVRFTTAQTLQREAFILTSAARGAGASAGFSNPSTWKAVEEDVTLGADQRAAVSALITGGDQVALLVGPAGAGKSRSLDAARAAWEKSGFRVLGLAPSAMAAAVLQEQAGIASETIAMVLRRVKNNHTDAALNRRTVVVVDEASMVRTIDLFHLVHHTAQARAKLVLVGDPNQLGAVGAGGVFRTLVGDASREGRPVAELETVRRFRHAWEAAASLKLRAHDPAILASYQRHDRIEGGTREEMIESAFTAWQRQREAGKSVVVMAGDNATVDEIARRARAERVQRGEVEPEGVALPRGTVGVGDEIVTLKNDRVLRTERGEFVRNGERWQVTDRDPGGALQVASLEGRGSLVLPSSYVAEHVALAYALTVHKAQGQTVDTAVLVVDTAMTAQQLYVGMSRGRAENRALVVCEELDLEHGRDRIATPVEVLGAVMRRNDLDRSAHEVMRTELSRYENRVFLADLSAEANRYVEREAGPDHSAEIAEQFAAHERVTRRLADLREHWERAAQSTRDAQRQLADVKRWAALPPAERARESPHIPRVELQHAEEAVRFAERNERGFSGLIERANHDAYEMSGAGGSLDQLRDAQARREKWMAEHPKETEWARALEERLAARVREAEMERHARGNERDVTAQQTHPRYPRHQADAGIEEQRGLTVQEDAVREEEVPEQEPRERRVSREGEPYYREPERGISWEERMAELEPPDLGPGGPVIGM